MLTVTSRKAHSGIVSTESKIRQGEAMFYKKHTWDGVWESRTDYINGGRYLGDSCCPPLGCVGAIIDPFFPTASLSKESYVIP